MEYGTSMQIYRYHEPKTERYFISIRKEIEYGEFLRLRHIQRV